MSKEQRKPGGNGGLVSHGSCAAVPVLAAGVLATEVLQHRCTANPASARGLLLRPLSQLDVRSREERGATGVLGDGPEALFHQRLRTLATQVLRHDTDLCVIAGGA